MKMLNVTIDSLASCHPTEELSEKEPSQNVNLNLKMYLATLCNIYQALKLSSFRRLPDLTNLHEHIYFYLSNSTKLQTL